jgi:ATP:corrinoid adenosyltransferase
LTFYAEKYVKELFGIRRVEGAFQRLDKLTQEEARMAEVEILTIAHRIDENVIRVDENVIRVDENVVSVAENVEVINEGVQSVHVIVTGIDDKLESTHADVQGVHREVSLINTGDLFFASPRIRPQPYSLRCEGGQRRDQGRDASGA